MAETTGAQPSNTQSAHETDRAGAGPALRIGQRTGKVIRSIGSPHWSDRAIAAVASIYLASQYDKKGETEHGS